MSDYSVVVVDGTRARFFTLEPAAHPEIESGPFLVEHDDLVNADSHAPAREMWSENKTGRNRAANGGPAHGYDDHRSNHHEEFERRFARSVADRTSSLVSARKAKHVVLVAQRRMLGFLRSPLDSLQKRGVAMAELGKDLIKLSPHELHEHLSRENLLPQRKRPGV